VRYQDYLAIERFPTILKQQQQQQRQQQQQQHWKTDMKLCGLQQKIEQAMKMGKIEGSAKDSGTMMRYESKEDSDIGKPLLYGLAKSRCIIDHSNVFAKDRHSFAMGVYLSASARFQNFA
jgi:hypothetical protein